jgi:hypothetical protein
VRVTGKPADGVVRRRERHYTLQRDRPVARAETEQAEKIRRHAPRSGSTLPDGVL